MSGKGFYTNAARFFWTEHRVFDGSIGAVAVGHGHEALDLAPQFCSPPGPPSTRAPFSGRTLSPLRLRRRMLRPWSRCRVRLQERNPSLSGCRCEPVRTLINACVGLAGRLRCTGNRTDKRNTRKHCSACRMPDTVPRHVQRRLRGRLPTRPCASCSGPSTRSGCTKSTLQRRADPSA
jgi:hypothetical protein